MEIKNISIRGFLVYSYQILQSKHVYSEKTKKWLCIMNNFGRNLEWLVKHLFKEISLFHLSDRMWNFGPGLK